jgi:hypothetical protein
MPDVSVPAPPPLVRIPHVELIHTGTWPISTGVWTATREDLQAAVAALDCPAIHRAGIKIGHVDQRFTDPTQDGEPLLGYIDNLAGEDDWNTLVGDYAGVPAWLGGTDADGNSVISSAYPQRSIEGIHDFHCQIGHVHPFVLTSVALLGVTHPGVGTLQSLPDLMALYGVAAAADPANGIRVTAAVHDIPLTANTQATAGPGERSTMPNPSPTKVAAGVTTEDVRRQYYDDAPDWDYWITEFHLDPLQLIVCDDRSGKHYRVAVNLTGEDTFTFGEPAEVLVRYVDAQSDATVTASAPTSGSYTPPAPSPGPDSGPAAANEPDRGPAGPARRRPRRGRRTHPFRQCRACHPPPDPPPADVPAAEPDATTNQEDDMSLSAIRARLGLGDDADEAAVLAALDAKLPTGPAESTTAPEASPPSPRPS